MGEQQKIARTMQGRVVSNRMDKTISVRIERRIKHPLYKKYVKKSTKVLAHDAENQCREGDMVTIQETRPLSKQKSWLLVNIDERAAEI